MIHEKVHLADKQADGYVIPLGPVSLVFVVTERGLIGCGAFDVTALDKFNYPAARVKSKDGGPIAGIDGLLAGEIKDANETSMKLGIGAGMNAREAIGLL